VKRAVALGAVVLAAAGAFAGPLEIERASAPIEWAHCALEQLGESRPATPCAHVRLLAAAKDVVVPPGGTLDVQLDAGGLGAVWIVTEAYTYAAPPADPVAVAMLADFERLVKQGTNDHLVERGVAHEPSMRPAPQPAVSARTPPASLTLRFAGDDAGRKAVYAVWGWAAPTPPDLRVALDPLTVRAGDGLRVGFGVQEAGWNPGAAPVTFVVSAQPEGGAPVALWSRRLHPAHRAGDRGWIDAEIDLARVAGKAVRVTLVAQAEGDATTFPVWARPIVVRARHEAPLPPSVLLVSLDTVREDHLSLAGYARETSPALAAFAKDAVVFEQAIAPFPSTTASHMSMLTGLHPCAHRVIVPSVSLAPGVPTLAQVLAGAGYATGAVTEDGLIRGEAGFDRGFDEYRDVVWTGEEPLGLFPDTIEFARAWLVRHADLPFFFFLHTYQPHVPFKVAPYYRTLFVPPAGAADAQIQAAAYDAGLRYTDDYLASLFGWLARAGLLERTLVIVTSDHGTEFGEHGGIGHARGVYDEQVHVPLLFRHPTLVRGGRRIGEPVSSVDILPTVLGLLGIAPPAGVQGTSLVACLRGEACTRGEVFAEQLWGARQTVRRAGPLAWVERQEGLELYDVVADPHETKNLAAARPDEARAGQASIAAFRSACTEAAARVRAATAPPLDAEHERALRALGYLR
jgi:arylsulfatase A-like enzyme